MLLPGPLVKSGKSKNNFMSQQKRMLWVLKRTGGYSKEPSHWDGSFKLPKHMHTCHTSRWDKISQNLALLKADSLKIFKSHRIFRPAKNTIYEEIIIKHTLLCLPQVSYNKIKAFWLLGGGGLQSDFCENLTEFYQISLKFEFISQISVHSLWHVCIC